MVISNVATRKTQFRSVNPELAGHQNKYPRHEMSGSGSLSDMFLVFQQDFLVSRDPGPGLASRLFQQSHCINHHAAVDRLEHVVDG